MAESDSLLQWNNKSKRCWVWVSGADGGEREFDLHMVGRILELEWTAIDGNFIKFK